MIKRANSINKKRLKSPSKKRSQSVKKNVKKNEDKSDVYEIKISDESKTYSNSMIFGVDKETLIRYTNVSIFSITPKDQSEFIASLLLSFFKSTELKNMTLLDGSACIGGNSWTFAKLVKKVISNEISKISSKILKHNMKVLRINNIAVMNKNIVKLAENDKSDIAFFDPPWGGVDYKKSSKISLYYSYGGKNVELSDLIRSYFARRKLIIIKLPTNYNFELLRNIYPYMYSTDIKTTSELGEKVLYRVVILSPKQIIQKFKSQTFLPFMYKSIIYDKL
jgi:16S rRNA G966 N2-methylase RsmD